MDENKGKRVSVRFIRPDNKMWIISPYWGFVEPLDTIAISFYEYGLPETCYIDKCGDTYQKVDENGEDTFIIEYIETHSEIFNKLVNSKIDDYITYHYFDKMIKSEELESPIENAYDLKIKSPESYKILYQEATNKLLKLFNEKGLPLKSSKNENK